MVEAIEEIRPTATGTASEFAGLRNRRDELVDSSASSHSAPDSIDSRDSSAPVDRPTPLHDLDVACLIINKMVGTGIFTAPISTLLVVNSKSLVLIFWFLGFVYTLISMRLYLELAREIPMSGGELIYVRAMNLHCPGKVCLHHSSWTTCIEGEACDS
jgi:hypothetical protein